MHRYASAITAAHDPRNGRYAEQSFLAHVCQASRSTRWRQQARCELECVPLPARDYLTGCSPPAAWEPAAAFHYNCQPRGTAEAAVRLLARSDAGGVGPKLAGWSPWCTPSKKSGK